MKWRDVPIFISSTFNDMHAERDYLVKYVFPELKAWCEARRLRLIDVDLRWGVTRADAQANNTVFACLNSIDECRPFFLCFLGQRRGWVPGEREVSRRTLEAYPGVGEKAGSHSVTEIEIEHALLQPLLRFAHGAFTTPREDDHALFFFRENPFGPGGRWLTPAQRNIYTNAGEGPQGEEMADRALEALKRRVEAKKPVLCHYACRWDAALPSPELSAEAPGADQGRLTGFAVDGRPLKDVLLEQLKREIEKAYPDRKHEAGEPESALEKEERFIAACTDAYIPRRDDFSALDAYVNGGRGVFVLAARAGLGKTTLLGKYAAALRARGLRVYARYCGVSSITADVYELWKSLFQELGQEPPSTEEELRLTLGRRLSAFQGVLLIDGLNQTQGGLEMLGWLPMELPEGVRLIVSYQTEERSAALTRALSQNPAVTLATVRPFESRAEKQSLIDAYLSRYFKHLDAEQLDAICAAGGASNPLYLKIMLAELRVFGAFKQLDAQIRRFGQTPAEAFDVFLERMETDPAFLALPPRQVVPLFFGLLAAGENGLTEGELLLCFQNAFPSAAREDLLDGIRYYARQAHLYLARRDGRLDFLYESLLLTSRRRYREGELRCHGLLTDAFRGLCDPAGDGSYSAGDERALHGYCRHLHKVRPGECAALLEDVPYLNARCATGQINRLIGDLRRFGGDGNAYLPLASRFASVLTRYPNVFFSLLLQSPECGQRALALLPGWPAPCLLPTPLYLPERREARGMAIRAHLPLNATVAVGLSEDGRYGFYSEGVGRIRVLTMAEMNTAPQVISVKPARPLDILVSPTLGYLAVTLEDETVDLLALTFDDSGFVASRPLNNFPCALPVFDDPAAAFLGDDLWLQQEQDSISCIAPQGETLRFSCPGELRAALPDGDSLLLCLNGEDSQRWYRATRRGLVALGGLPGDPPLCGCVGENHAVALSQAERGVLQYDASLRPRGTGTGEVLYALTTVPGGFVGVNRAGSLVWLGPEGNRTEPHEEIVFRQKLCLRRDGGGGLAILTDLGAFYLEETHRAEAARERVVAAFPWRDGLARITRNGDGKYDLRWQNRRVEWDTLFGNPLFLRQGDHIYMLGNQPMAQGCSLADGRLFPFPLEAGAESACATPYGLCYCTVYHQLCMEGRKMPNLTGYYPQKLAVACYGDLLVVTGIVQNAKAGMEQKPYLLLIYHLEKYGCTRLCERYFPYHGGAFVFTAFDAPYLLLCFATPFATARKPVLRFGTPEQLAREEEQMARLDFELNQVSAAARDGVLYVCADGVLRAFRVDGAEPLATTENQRRLRDVCASPVGVLGVHSDGSVAEYALCQPGEHGGPRAFP